MMLLRVRERRRRSIERLGAVAQPVLPEGVPVVRGRHHGFDLEFQPFILALQSVCLRVGGLLAGGGRADRRLGGGVLLQQCLFLLAAHSLALRGEVLGADAFGLGRFD